MNPTNLLPFMLSASHLFALGQNEAVWSGLYQAVRTLVNPLLRVYCFIAHALFMECSMSSAKSRYLEVLLSERHPLLGQLRLAHCFRRHRGLRRRRRNGREVCASRCQLLIL